MSDIDITQRCIDLGSTDMDVELNGLVPLLSQEDDSFNNMWSQGKECSTQEASLEVEEQQEASSQEINSQKLQENPLECQYSNESSMPRKNKVIQKVPVHYASFFDSEDESERPKKKPKDRRKRGQADGYPTKNFLSTFKGPHLQFLEEFLGVELVYSFKICMDIKGKNGISMSDYESLYRTPEFEGAFLEMFKSGYLFRALMLSRASPKARKVYINKIKVFEEAFIAQEFNKIN